MIIRLHRKISQLTNDPVLRRWLVGRLLGRWSGEPSFVPHQPPYLSKMLPLGLEAPKETFAGIVPGCPTGKIDLYLAGQTLTLTASDCRDVFRRTFSDVETLLALHRFAWLPLMEDSVDPAWVDILWQAWCVDYGKPSDHWAWHPYTATERAVNILAFGRRHGLPGDSVQTLQVLAAHGPAIADRLEYFGEHHTSNHLLNNGRGLYILGVELGLPEAARMGLAILTNEFDRVFSGDGVLREGSSHYQLLLARSYAEVWLAARRHSREETDTLEGFTQKILAATAAMVLPGGLSVIGDISPDCSPRWLAAMLPGGAGGWLDRLTEDDARAFLELRQGVVPTPVQAMGNAGWYRLEGGPFSMISHVAPGGWSHMPGHGHQDTGGFELHVGDEAVIIDSGRGAYGETGDAAYYRSGCVHNGLMVDGADPYPPNRPYYDETFRRTVGGPIPRVDCSADTMTLSHHGFSRLSGVAVHERRWHVTGNRMTIEDRLDGSGRHDLVRTFVTPLTPRRENGAIVLQGNHSAYCLGWDDDGVDVMIEPVMRWHAYGAGNPAHVIRLTSPRARLPWRGAITFETTADAI